MDVEGKALTLPGQPYSAAQLQRDYAGHSPQAVYAKLCDRFKCRPLSGVTALLCPEPDVWDQRRVDLSATYVGPRGAVIVAELCKLMPQLEQLVLSGNYLTNQAVWYVCKMAAFHPTLQYIDFSRNDVSWAAGMACLELVTRNASIRGLGLHETHIRPKVHDAIAAQLRRNTGAAVASLGGVAHAANSTNHALTIRQRALKRLFRDLRQRHGHEVAAAEEADGVPADGVPVDGVTEGLEGAVPPWCLAEGLKELLRLAGRDAEVDQRGPQYYEAFCRRASGAAVGWEEFMVLVMLEEAAFDRPFVERTRAVFRQFEPAGAGYVHLARLGDMMAAVHGVVPTPDEVAAKAAIFAADATMTVSWDEFLLLMAHQAPVVGQLGSYASRTPLARPPCIHH